MEAAEQGIAEYMTRLTGMYLLGWGVPQDHVKAHMWYDLAAAAGDKHAPEFRDRLAREMAPADISKAQELARKRLEKYDEWTVHLKESDDGPIDNGLYKSEFTVRPYRLSSKKIRTMPGDGFIISCKFL